MMKTISKAQARKLILLAQRLPPTRLSGSAIDGTLASIQHLGYVQIDTISVIQRAHHHTLWNRNPKYKPEHLDQLVANKQVFEYWSHAASYLPMNEYRFTLPRKRDIKEGKQSHWFMRDEPLMKSVRQRIQHEGPLMAKDFNEKQSKVEKVNTSKNQNKDWTSKPAKQALENLYLQGDLMIAERRGFHKVYDLTERVLPPNIDTRLPSAREYAQFLIRKYLTVNGLGLASEMAYLLKNVKQDINLAIADLLATAELIQVKVSGVSYYALSSIFDLLNTPFARSKLKILSPFDNLLIQRKRMQHFFDFDYLIECYVAKEKRQYGYFALPILWAGKLVARMDCKAEQKDGTLHVYNLVTEPSLTNIDAFAQALHNELNRFMIFNQCQQIRLHQSTPSSLINVLDELSQKNI